MAEAAAISDITSRYITRWRSGPASLSTIAFPFLRSSFLLYRIRGTERIGAQKSGAGCTGILIRERVSTKRVLKCRFYRRPRALQLLNRLCQRPRSRPTTNSTRSNCEFDRSTESSSDFSGRSLPGRVDAISAGQTNRRIFLGPDTVLTYRKGIGQSAKGQRKRKVLSRDIEKRCFSRRAVPTPTRNGVGRPTRSQSISPS